MAKGTPINVTLNVAKVDNGGNSENGGYFYSFTPKVLMIEEEKVKITYELGPDTSTDFVVEDFFTTDSKFQLKNIKIHSRRVTMTHVNSEAELIYICVRVKHEPSGDFIECDPQVVNRPL